MQTRRLGSVLSECSGTVGGSCRPVLCRLALPIPNCGVALSSRRLGSRDYDATPQPVTTPNVVPAFLVNVTASICSGLTCRVEIRSAILIVSVAVFPLPAPATIINGDAPSYFTARSCSGLRFTRSDRGILGGDAAGADALLGVTAHLDCESSESLMIPCHSDGSRTASGRDRNVSISGASRAETSCYPG